MKIFSVSIGSIALVTAIYLAYKLNQCNKKIKTLEATVKAAITEPEQPATTPA